MNRSSVTILVVSILLVMLVVSGCAAPKTASIPTTKALSCPTAATSSCPTPAAQAIPQMNPWRQEVSAMGNVVITFDKGDKCSMQVESSLIAPEINYEIVVNDSTYQNYMLDSVILDPGKTLADLQAWTSVDNGPPWAQEVGLDIVNTVGRTAHSHAIPIPGQLYFICFVEGPGSLKIIGSVGPVEVPAK